MSEWTKRLLTENFLSQNKGLIVFLVLMFAFRSSLADWNDVPTSSMKPNIVEGDRILINKIAYDLRIPFTDVKLAHFADPERGDIVIFNSKAAGIRLVKRVVAIPGDVVLMRNNVLSVNDQQLQYELIEKTEETITLNENLLGQKYPINILPGISKASNFGPVIVPENTYMALGDNRDNSADSRFIGFIPRNEIIGRSRTVVMSLDYDDYYLPRRERFLKALSETP